MVPTTHGGREPEMSERVTDAGPGTGQVPHKYQHRAIGGGLNTHQYFPLTPEFHLKVVIWPGVRFN
jgi:hypothetical protein